METAVGAALLPGAALGGVLAVAGAWSRLARGPALPHLGIGALAGLLALVTLRLAALPAPLVLLAAVAVGGAAGGALGLLDERVRRLGERAPGIAARPAAADLAVLAAVLAGAALLRPPTAIPLPFGPLGGRPGTTAAAAALVLGSAGAAALGWRRFGTLPPVARWAGAGALLGVVVALAAGALSANPLAIGGIVGLPDTAGLALRALAVGLAARRDALDAAAAGVALGVAEMVLAALVPLGGLALLPAVAAVAVGLVVHVRDRSVR
jgi:hypothetical protein